jgi:hypothetical protein
MTAILLLAVSIPSASKLMQPKARPETINVRLIARERPIDVTGFGRNVDSYLVQIETSDGQRRLGRMSFRYLLYEEDIPPSFRDYLIVHTFKATRDAACDLVPATLNNADLSYSDHAPRLGRLEAGVPCYVVTPASYRKSQKRDAATRGGSEVASLLTR